MSRKMGTVPIFLALLLVVACVLPFVLTSYRTFQATLVLIVGVLLVRPSGLFGKPQVSRV